MPAMVIVPVRVTPALASKVKVASPLPLPVELVWIQGTLDVAVQLPLVATTWVPVPAAGPRIRAVVSTGCVCVWNAPISGGESNGEPRWSVVTPRTAEPLPIAGLPGSRAMVGVGPPLYANSASLGSIGD